MNQILEIQNRLRSIEEEMDYRTKSIGISTECFLSNPKYMMPMGTLMEMNDLLIEKLKLQGKLYELNRRLIRSR